MCIDNINTLFPKMHIQQIILSEHHLAVQIK